MHVSRWLSLATAAVVAAAFGAPAAAAPATQAAASLLAQLSIAHETAVGYDRALFGDGWIDADGDGCDTRAEVLKVRTSVPVTYSSGCTVATGSWHSVYDGATWSETSSVDIDHTVALSEAWRSGAHTWTTAQRLAFANDLDFAPALQAMTDDVNQSKGDRDPTGWLPPIEATRCRYAVEWVSIKWRWDLAVDRAEADTLGSLLAGDCGATTVIVERAVVVAPPAAPAPPPAPPADPAAPAGDKVLAGQTLGAGQSVASLHGGHRLVMQTDGNLVVYTAAGRAVWSTGTHGNPGARFVFQGDGNAVVHASSGRVLWHSSTHGRGGDRITVQDDGNLVVYTAADAVLWHIQAPPPPPPPPSASAPVPPPARPATPRPVVRYANCAAVRAAGAAPIYRGQPGYASHLDRDDDGIGCER